ncbi:hypothetical protein D3C86_963590 [compost metagenome]
MLHALHHDAVHAEGDAAVHARVGAVGAQHVADLGAAERGGRVDVGNGAARAGLDRAQLGLAFAGGDVQRVDPVFVVRLDAGQHDVRAEALDADRAVAGRRQALVEFGDRAFAGHQQREAVGELVQRLDAVGPLQARQALVLGVEAHQAQRLRLAGLRKKVAEPLGGDVAHVVGRDFVLPHAHAHRLLDAVEGQVQRQHAGRAQHDLGVLHLRLDERHARQLPLGDELALRIDHHPGPVELQAGFGEQHLVELDAGARLDGVHEQAGDGGLEIESGRLRHGGGFL